jgi:beta-barrel assembly-enhancing protease
MAKRLIALLLLTVAVVSADPKKKLPKPGMNFFSKEQDVQMGREYAQQVEQQMRVVPDKELTAYINRIGQRLVQQGQLDPYPFYFKVVQEPSINAFALPGGPMYVHTGLIKAADNEAQIAGVLAHELSHVVLRHGTHQASKAQLIQIPALLAGSLAGGSLVGQLAQLGIGLGANSVLLKFSRGAESDADLMGAYIMARAGYNPIEMARFFEKLEQEMGNNGNSKVAQFFSDHPNPGNRVQAIEGQLPYMPRSDYGASEGDLTKIKAIVDKLPPLPKPKGQPGAPQTSSQPENTTPSPLPRAPLPNEVTVSPRQKTYQARGFSINYPDDWEAVSGQGSLTIAPKAGKVGDFVGYGVIINAARAPSGHVNLAQDTQALLNAMVQNNSNMKVIRQSSQTTVGGSPALVTQLSSDSPYANTREVDLILTVDRGSNFVYFVFVAPERDYPRLEAAFKTMLNSVRFQ